MESREQRSAVLSFPVLVNNTTSVGTMYSGYLGTVPTTLLGAGRGWVRGAQQRFMLRNSQHGFRLESQLLLLVHELYDSNTQSVRPAAISIIQTAIVWRNS